MPTIPITFRFGITWENTETRVREQYQREVFERADPYRISHYFGELKSFASANNLPQPSPADCLLIWQNHVEHYFKGDLSRNSSEFLAAWHQAVQANLKEPEFEPGDDTEENAQTSSS